MFGDRWVNVRKRGAWISAVARVALVLMATGCLFLTLSMAGYAARLPLVPPVADLSIVKTDANPDVRPGGTLTYQIVYQNSGTLPATDVVITDTLPADTTHLFNGASSEGWTTTISGTLVIWHRDVISPAVSGSFDVVLRVSEDAPAGASLVNHVEIATATDEGDTSNNSWTTQPTVVRVADVHVTKTGPVEVTSGDRITYTIQYQNQGSEPADNVILTDTLPAGVSYVTWSSDSGTPPAVTGQQVVWQLGSLLPASGGTLTLVGEIDPDEPSYSLLVNTASISTQTPERDMADNTDTSTAVVRAGPPASVQVSAPATIPVATTTRVTALVLDRWAHPVADGTPVSFTASSLVTVDPSALTVSGRSTVTLHAGTQVGPVVVTATAGSAVGVGHLEVVPGPVGDVQLMPSVSSQTAGEPVGLRADVFDSFGNPVDAGIMVSFTTTLGDVLPASAATNAAGVVTATLTSTRTGTALVTAHAGGTQSAASVLFVPGTPENISVSADPASIPVDGAKSQIMATIADRYGNRVGDGITVTFDSSLGSVNPVTTTTVAGRATTVLTSGHVHGQAAVTATVGTYTGTTQVMFLPADLRVQSTHTPSTDILPGTAVTYTITFENAGDAVARDVMITDTLPIGFIDTWYESSGAAITETEGSAYVWQVEDLSPGEGGTIVLRGHFDRHRQWPSSQLVANIVEITSTTAEGNPADNSVSAANLVLTADVFIQGNVDDSGTDLQPGKKIKYQVFLGNYGPALAQGLTITSTLPAHTSLWQETSYQIDGLTRVSADDAPVQVWQYDGIVDGPNFGDFVIWLNIDANAPGGALLSHHIEVSTNTPEGNYANNEQVIERRLSGINLETLVRGPSEVVPGRMITYTLRYTNTGTVPAENVVLTDMLPAGIAVIDMSRTPDRIELSRMEWDLGTVADGQWGQIVLVGRVRTDVSAGETLRNTLDITSSSVESYTDDNMSEVETLVIPDIPDSLTLQMNPTTVDVGTRTPILIRIADQYGNPIDGLMVNITTTVGVVTPTVATTRQGAAIVTFIAPTSPSEGAITATFNDLSDSIQVVVEPGPAAALRARAADAELPADGESTTVIEADVWDKYGNPVKDGTPVTFDTDLGTLYNGQTRHTVGTLDGVARTVLKAADSPGRAVIIVSAGTASAEITVEFLPVPIYDVYLPLLVRNAQPSSSGNVTVKRAP